MSVATHTQSRMILDNWQHILEHVKSEFELSDVSFRTWIAPLKVVDVDEHDHVVTVQVSPDQLAVNYINKKYYYPLKVAVTEFTGIEYDIRFVLQGTDSLEDMSRTDPSYLQSAVKKANLNSKYTFDTFVVGSNNQFAHAAALAVAESPGKIYNPLFIYGGAGLGKTHLMHSIAHFILTNDPECNVLYVTSESFTNELIDAIRNSSNSALSSFRDKYRNVDVLLIDDIQFIIGKEATQEEFFNTFNDLYGRMKQIIISSDKPPKQFDTLEERFRSRFEWGLLADISTPDYETRMAILHKKEESDGYDIDDAVISYIASNIKSNIRELEGALNKLIALSILEKREITVELAEEALKDIIAPEQSREITPELIISTVAEHFHLQPSDLTGTKKSNNVAIPRQIAMYLCRTMLDIPLKQIGGYVGGRDHSTVIHGVNKIEQELSKSDTMRNTVTIIRNKISPS